jgi:hypothetical protein
MHLHLFIFLLLTLTACAGEGLENNSTGTTGKTDTLQPQTTDALLVFSQQATIQGNVPENICRANFEDSTPLFPVGTDPRSRYFIADTGLYKVMVTAGNSKTSFLLKPRKDGKLELLTSQQFPLCLSGKANFHLNATGDGFHYDAGKYTQFDLQVQKSGTGFQVLLSWNESKELGLAVRHRLAG